MCGIAGIIYRDGTHEIGRDMTRMLQSMKHRGPDSTGYALYGPPNDGLAIMRYTLADSNTPRDFEFDERLERHQGRVLQRLKKAGADIREHEQETDYAHRVTFAYDDDLKDLTDRIEDIPDAEVLSIGRSLEIIKDLGDADTVCAQYDLDDFGGTHAIGHVRMATESDVDISGAHPYWAYPFKDVAVVHNGQLTNYFQWKRRLERSGHRFQSECDSEIIAVYLAEKMAEGADLESAMRDSLEELDGFGGTHAIGHVRMATESDVDISGAHPYWAYPFKDVAVVHNGQLTNYFQWKRRLERSGHRFQSECDSEIIAVYLAEKMSEGATLEDAMRESLEELDGVFTYICVTKDALGVAKDEMAAKPLVLYEADDLVALASEEIAIRAILDHEIDTYDPYEGEVLVWQR